MHAALVRRSAAVGRGVCLRPVAAVRECPPSRSKLSASRQALPGAGSCGGGRRCAPTALRCSVRGRAAELAAFAALTALEQPRRVRPRSVLRTPTPALRCSSLQKSPLAGSTCREIVALVLARNTRDVSAKARPGRLRSASEAPSSAGRVARARSAHQQLTCRRLFERSERSEFCGATPDRAAQCRLRAAPTATA